MIRGPISDDELDAWVARFVEVAPDEISRFFPKPNNCIAATRITEQVFEKFGVQVQPHPCRYICYAPSTEKAYVSAPHDEEWERRFAKAHAAIDLRTGPEFQGHLVAIAGRWLIDPAWGAAGEFLGFAERGVLAFKLAPEFDRAEHLIYSELEFSNGLHVQITYEPLDDPTYQDAPAWELDHLEPAIGLIWRRMNGAPPETFKQFVVYRRPRDFPMASIVVRRWQLIGGQMVADVKPAMVLAGPEALALEYARDRLASKGLIRWERFLQDDPVIVEVWF